MQKSIIMAFAWVLTFILSLIISVLGGAAIIVVTVGVFAALGVLINSVLAAFLIVILAVMVVVPIWGPLTIMVKARELMEEDKKKRIAMKEAIEKMAANKRRENH